MVQDAPLMTQVAMPAAAAGPDVADDYGGALVKVEAPPTAPKISALGDAGCGATCLVD